MLRVSLSSLLLLCACGSARPFEDAGAHEPDASVPVMDIPDASVPLPDPSRIAGALTISTYGTRPFLSPAEVEEVLQTGYSFGREFFVGTWVAAPNAQRPNLDGLGPLFHAESCVACHPASGRPPAFADDGTVDVGILFRLVGPNGGDPVFGGQLQPRGLPGVDGEARITFTRGAEDKAPTFHFATSPNYGVLAPTTHALPRLSPHLAGMGLLEAVSDEALLALEDPNDLDGDGVSGRAARLAHDAGIGRFGWKAVQPTLSAQSAAAFAGDMGITSPGHADDCSDAQPTCRAMPHGGEPEARDVDLEAVSIFMRYLGVPAARRTNDDVVINRGHAVFEYVGCGSCHRETMRTSRDVVFHAYTDLLLHDLGDALADPVGEGVAQPAEWRTPPLWGLGLVEKDEKARFLHDGRAASIHEAIRWHGGEAAQARARFEELRAADVDALLAFVRSL